MESKSANASFDIHHWPLTGPLGSRQLFGFARLKDQHGFWLGSFDSLRVFTDGFPSKNTGPGSNHVEPGPFFFGKVLLGDFWPVCVIEVKSRP